MISKYNSAFPQGEGYKGGIQVLSNVRPLVEYLQPPKCSRNSNQWQNGVVVKYIIVVSVVLLLHHRYH